MSGKPLGVDVRVVTLEDAKLPVGDFDLAVAASCFHWVDEAVGLAKLFGSPATGRMVRDVVDPLWRQ